jgi:hypothetical protein
MIPSQSIPNKVWIFRHERDESIKTNIAGRSFKRDRLLIEPSGEIIVKCSYGNGYAWDGCTPKWNCLHFTWGTPDGKLQYETGKPMSYYASMFHDALYQFKNEKDMCISRKETDLIFKMLMQRNKFIWSTVYYIAVRMFGGFCGKWNRKTSKYGIKISDCSWE